MPVASREPQDAPEPRRDTRAGARGGAGWARWRGAVGAEFLASALLVLLSCLPACAGVLPALRPLAAGLAVALLVQCFDHISGAMMNPAVLLAALCARRVPGAAAAAMLAAQLAGAALGAALLPLLAPAQPTHPAALCLTLPREDLPLYKAVAIEAMLGGLLALANLASWDPRNRLLADSWPLRIGLSVAGLSVVAGELTGASMNPARSLAPALLAARWEHHWVYWVGPLSGSLACSLLYLRAWAPPPAPRPPARAAPSPPPSPRTPRAPPPAPVHRLPKETHYSV